MSDVSTVSNKVLERMTAWAEGLLAEGHLPESSANIDTLVAQQYWEGGPGQTQSGKTTNPLDVVNGPHGSIGPFQDTQTGYQTTLDTLQQNDPAYYQSFKSNTGTDPTTNIAALGVSQWEGLNPGSSKQNKAYATNVSNSLTDLYTNQVNWGSIATTPSGTKVVSPGSQYDTFTQAMISLDGVLHSGGTVPLEMFLARAALALGFASVGLIGILGMVSGGKISASSVPNIAAGFLGGPETGLFNVVSKLGIRSKSGNAEASRDLAQQRIGLASQRETRVTADAERRAIENAQKKAQNDQRILQAQYRAKTQRKSVNLKAKQLSLTTGKIGP